MDPLTHGLVGGLAAKTAGVSRRRFWIMMGLGMVPDLDFLANYFGEWAMVFQHRGISHSFLGIILQSFVLAWVLARWDKGNFKERLFHYSLPLGLHVLGDTFTSYGVPLLSPFELKTYSIDLLVSLSLIPIGFMFFGLWRLHKKDAVGWRVTRPLWGFWALYLVLAFSGKVYAHRLVNVNQGNVSTLPAIINPLSWRGIHVDDQTQTYREYSLDLWTGQKKMVRAFDMPNGDFPIKASLKSAKVQAFLQDYRWPMVRFGPSPNGWDVEWGNLLFSTLGEVRSKVQVSLSEDGQILTEKNSFGFWNPKS